jgi:hypothetical protein
MNRADVRHNVYAVFTDALRTGGWTIPETYQAVSVFKSKRVGREVQA